MSATKKYQSPVKLLSNFFTLILLLLVSGLGLLLFFAFKELPPYAQSVNQKLEQTQLIDPEKSPGQQPNTTLQKAGIFFATPQSYQEKVTVDILAYAKRSGINVESITPAAETYTLNVQTNGAAPYATTMGFLMAIENNLPNLEIQELTLTKASSSSVDSLAIRTLKIRVSVR